MKQPKQTSRRTKPWYLILAVGLLFLCAVGIYFMRDSAPVATQTHRALTLLPVQLPDGWTKDAQAQLAGTEMSPSVDELSSVLFSNHSNRCYVSVGLEDINMEYRSTGTGAIRQAYFERDAQPVKAGYKIARVGAGSLTLQTSRGVQATASQLTHLTLDDGSAEFYREFTTLPRSESSLTTVMINCPKQADLRAARAILNGVRITVQ